MKYILLAFRLVIGFIFMLYVTVRARRRGYYKWAWVAILTETFSLSIAGFLFPEAVTAANSVFGWLLLLSSPLVSIVTFRKSTKPIAPPAKCPECGHSGAARGRVILDQKTGKEVSSKFTGIVLLVGGSALSLMIIGMLTWDFPVTFPLPVAFILVVINIYVAASGLGILTQRPINTVEKMKHKCGACKHTWTQ